MKFRLVCNNESCINKSPVWRKFDRLKEHRCKNCGWLLVIFKDSTRLEAKQNLKAKQELGERGNVT